MLTFCQFNYLQYWMLEWSWISSKDLVRIYTWKLSLNKPGNEAWSLSLIDIKSHLRSQNLCLPLASTTVEQERICKTKPQVLRTWCSHHGHFKLRGVGVSTGRSVLWIVSSLVLLTKYQQSEDITCIPGIFSFKRNSVCDLQEYSTV